MYCYFGDLTKIDERSSYSFISSFHSEKGNDFLKVKISFCSLSKDAFIKISRSPRQIAFLHNSKTFSKVNIHFENFKSTAPSVSYFGSDIPNIFKSNTEVEAVGYISSEKLTQVEKFIADIRGMQFVDLKNFLYEKIPSNSNLSY